MGLGLPLALLAALGIAIPIAAHLARQRDLPRVAFPALALLRNAEAESKERVRFKDRPLLALRILLVIALALAASAPFLWRAGAFADGEMASLVIIVDDSMSMEGAWESLRERAEDAIDALPSGSEVALVAAGSPARTLAALGTDHGAALSALEGIRTGGRGTDLGGAAVLASQELAAARFGQRVLTLSDFAAADTPAWPRGAELAFERTAPSTTNAAILECSAAADPTRPGFHSVRVLISAPEGPRTLSVEAPNGETLSQETVAVGSDGRASLIMGVAIPADTAHVTLVLSDEDESILADNRRSLLLDGAGSRRVLIVDGDPARSESRFVTRALDVAPPLPGGARLEYRVVDTGRFVTTPLDDFQVILMLDSALPHPALERFLQGGGGLAVAVGPHVERSSLRDQLPARIGEARSEAVHAESEWASLDGVWATDYVELEAKPGAEVIARWSSGSPAFVIDGGIALLSTSLDDDWTEFPYAPGFVAFLHQLLTRIGESDDGLGTYVAGESVRVASGESVHMPNGEVRFHEAGPFVDTGDVGVYRVGTGDEVATFVIVPDAGESQVRPGALPSERRGGDARGPASKAPFGAWIFLLFGLGVAAEGMMRLIGRRGRRGAAR